MQRRGRVLLNYEHIMTRLSLDPAVVWLREGRVVERALATAISRLLL